MGKAHVLGPDPNPALTRQNMDAVKANSRVDSDNDD
jgi:hypothetical protein